MDHREHCALFGEEVDRFAMATAAAGATAPVPSCPGWTVADLSLHLGRVHRWVDPMVRVLAPKRIGSADAVADEGPPTPEWIREGGAGLLGVLQAADPDAPMWAWGPDQHVRFWSRRMLHEALVHRMDAELAAGGRPEVAPPVAADAVDEFLGNLRSAARFSPEVRHLHGDGERIDVRPADADRAWTITLEPDGFSVADGPAPAPAASLSGRAADLLAVLYRRAAPADAGVSVGGDPALASFWLAHSVLV